MDTHSIACGAPTIEPRGSSSAKHGIGAAYHAGSCLSFTRSPGIINGMYFPHIDSPNTRDLQFLLTDGHTFYQEENRDLEHLTDPEQRALLYQLTNSESQGRRCIKVRRSLRSHQHTFTSRGVESEEEMTREQFR